MRRRGGQTIPYGIRIGRDRQGWWAKLGRPTLYGRTGRSVTGATGWELVKFLIVPSRYYVWRYNREKRLSPNN